MKKLHRNLIRAINMVLASMIAALGVAGCSHQKNAAKQQKATEDDQPNAVEEAQVSQVRDEMVCMYGVPRAQYAVKGRVEDMSGMPLIRKKIIVEIGRDRINVDTDGNGKFDVTFDGFPAEEITFEIDGQRYTEKVTYDSEPVDAWNRGTATMNVLIYHATPQQHRPMMVKYGVPPTRMEK